MALGSLTRTMSLLLRAEVHSRPPLLIDSERSLSYPRYAWQEAARASCLDLARDTGKELIVQERIFISSF